jgi:RNA polymerase-binding transcription factor DksA
MPDTITIKSILEEELFKIREDLKSIATRNTETGDFEAIPDVLELSETDPNSEADAVETWNERRATVASLETLYRDGSYGLCEICGNNIEHERLAAIMTARTCITHKDEGRTLSL